MLTGQERLASSEYDLLDIRSERLKSAQKTLTVVYILNDRLISYGYSKLLAVSKPTRTRTVPARSAPKIADVRKPDVPIDRLPAFDGSILLSFQRNRHMMGKTFVQVLPVALDPSGLVVVTGLAHWIRLGGQESSPKLSEARAIPYFGDRFVIHIRQWLCNPAAGCNTAAMRDMQVNPRRYAEIVLI